MYKGRRLGSIPSKGNVLGFVERIEFTFDVHVDVSFVGMLDMVMSLGWATSSPPPSKSIFLDACTSSPGKGGRWFADEADVTMSPFSLHASKSKETMCVHDSGAHHP